jgi:hypothetical protein
LGEERPLNAERCRGIRRVALLTVGKPSRLVWGEERPLNAERRRKGNEDDDEHDWVRLRPNLASRPLSLLQAKRKKIEHDNENEHDKDWGGGKKLLGLATDNRH